MTETCIAPAAARIRTERLLREMPPATAAPFATLLGCAAGLAILILVVAIGARMSDRLSVAASEVQAVHATAFAGETARAVTDPKSRVAEQYAPFAGAARAQLAPDSLRESTMEGTKR